MGQCVKQNKKCLCSLNALLPTTKLSLFPQQPLATREAATKNGILVMSQLSNRNQSIALS